MLAGGPAPAGQNTGMSNRPAALHGTPGKLGKPSLCQHHLVELNPFLMMYWVLEWSNQHKTTYASEINRETSAKPPAQILTLLSSRAQIWVTMRQSNFWQICLLGGRKLTSLQAAAFLEALWWGVPLLFIVSVTLWLKLSVHVVQQQQNHHFQCLLS